MSSTVDGERSPPSSRATVSPLSTRPRCAPCSTSIGTHRRLGRLRRELGRSRPGHLHGRRRPLPEAAARGVRARAGDRRIRRKPHQPHYQSRDYNPLNGGIERWFEPVCRRSATVPTHAAPSCAPAASCSSALTPVAGLAHRGAPVPHRGARRARPAGRRPKACIATASITCWCCWSIGENIAQRRDHDPRLDGDDARQLHPDRAARRGAGGRQPGVARRDARSSRSIRRRPGYRDVLVVTFRRE